jgi:tetratricopeptide (TPR) repeat protein
MNRFSFILIFLLAGLLHLSSPALHAQEPSPREAFLRGNIAYGNKAYAEAEAAYRQVLQSGSSARAHFNLGNALARQDRWSEAAFHYLRASAIDPRFVPARNNLLLANRNLGLDDPFPSLPAPANLLSRDRWAFLAAGAFWLSIFLFFHARLIPASIPLARTLGTLSLITLLAALFAFSQHQRFNGWSVVAAESPPLRVAPTSQSPGDLRLEKGLPVRIRDRQNDFVHVLTPSGSEGFLRLDEIHHVHKD